MNPILWVLDLLFPPKCPFCRSVLDDPRAPVCPACQPTLPWLEKKESFRKVDHTDGCRSVLTYRDRVKACIRRYKFTPVQAYAVPLGLLMAQCVADHPDIQPDFVTWVPLSRKSRRQRGFDQSRLLARSVARQLSLPLRPTLLKVRHTPRQSLQQTPAQRRANVLGAFAVRPGADLRGCRVLLVDDVITSGATLSACARELKTAGAAQIWCVTLAQAGK